MYKAKLSNKNKKKTTIKKNLTYISKPHQSNKNFQDRM